MWRKIVKNIVKIGVALAAFIVGGFLFGGSSALVSIITLSNPISIITSSMYNALCGGVMASGYICRLL